MDSDPSRSRCCLRPLVDDDCTWPDCDIFRARQKKSSQPANQKHIKSSDQDCDCIDHTGPHWKHMDNLWRARNRGYLAIVQDESRPLENRELAYFAFCQEEGLRLKEKLLHIKVEETHVQPLG
jgi:hypothetical protein